MPSLPARVVRAARPAASCTPRPSPCRSRISSGGSNTRQRSVTTCTAQISSVARPHAQKKVPLARSRPRGNSPLQSMPRPPRTALWAREEIPHRLTTDERLRLRSVHTRGRRFPLLWATQARLARRSVAVQVKCHCDEPRCSAHTCIGQPELSRVRGPSLHPPCFFAADPGARFALRQFDCPIAISCSGWSVIRCVECATVCRGCLAA